MTFFDTIKQVHQSRKVTEVASSNDDPVSQFSDAQSLIAQEIAQLKQFAAVGQDQEDLNAAIQYLEAAVIKLSDIIQRNVQKP